MAEHASSIPTPKIPRPHATDERFAKWWAAAQACDARADAAEADAEVAAIMGEKHQYEVHIAEHAAVGPGGLLIKSRLLLRLLETDRDVFAGGLAAEIVGHLEGMA
ncbi:hypothetical protein BZG35_03570 [Brevundimonas sp. LM2]|uniref:hypothetical protein n=1 Tax=Brevundimonas sp. LM2 TaxID=1938605 RepID=UPI0009840076|nr:hypothetical protein [Brevundimonas sp. LM2]AQR60835.1 hypothetical protein BZG35_03570 [Brevundimonas sp. LM2]